MKHIGIIYLFFFAILNLFLNCHFQLHYDESYYWAFSQNLDWSYYDHPPMISLLIRISNVIISPFLPIGIPFFNASYFFCEAISSPLY